MSWGSSRHDLYETVYLQDDGEYYQYLFHTDAGIPEMYCYRFTSTAENRRGKTIYLDPGHGTSDLMGNVKGERVLPLPEGHKAFGTGYLEGVAFQTRDSGEDEFALDIALRTKDLLLDAGYDVVLSRIDGERHNSNGGSGLLATQASDLMVAIHWNAGGGKGIEAYYLSDSCTSTKGFDYSTIVEDTGKDEAWVRKCKRLAELLCKDISEKTGLKNTRGVKCDADRIFLYTKVPAVLVETGFCDTPEDRGILDGKREEIARGYAEAIREFLE